MVEFRDGRLSHALLTLSSLVLDLILGNCASWNFRAFALYIYRSRPVKLRVHSTGFSAEAIGLRYHFLESLLEHVTLILILISKLLFLREDR